jgi:predicted GNAT family N-acyltransferase
MKVMAIRSIVYMSEQDCPYDEEFDGNDISGATHLIAWRGPEPVGTIRLRWFANFVKAERLAVRTDFRGGAVAAALIDATAMHAARKGYRRVLGHIQKRLLPFWMRYGKAFIREDRPSFAFSDREYIEVVRELTPDENALTIDTDALVLLRPEGAWDEPGVLDHSAERGTETIENSEHKVVDNAVLTAA